jgi:hypothetical protein
MNMETEELNLYKEHNTFIDNLKEHCSKMLDNENVKLECNKATLKRLLKLLLADEKCRDRYRINWKMKNPNSRKCNNRISYFKLNIVQ